MFTFADIDSHHGLALGCMELFEAGMIMGYLFRRRSDIAPSSSAIRQRALETVFIEFSMFRIIIC